MSDRFKVGDEIYVINSMWSMYGRTCKHEKYIPRKITSVTSRSYVCGEEKWNQQKIAKKHAMDKEQADRMVWVGKHSYRIHESAKNLQTYEELMKLAELTGWKE